MQSPDVLALIRGDARSFRSAFGVMLAAAAMAPLYASAECGDGPDPGVNWAGCEKHRLILPRRICGVPKLAGVDLSGSDLQGAQTSTEPTSRAPVSTGSGSAGLTSAARDSRN